MKTAFKIKLTHRDMYSVVPPSGFINPGERTVIDLILQPFEWNPAVAEKNKMLVQSLQMMPDDMSTVQDTFAMGIPTMDQKVVLNLPPPGAPLASPLDAGGFQEPMMPM
ncbi:unnamed protein product [Soboliphyme baturini]|uniref:MSP domain-containing protein n=1 Tax=Soboliphyme baturini TaxID=241478 RepID=A0A183IKN2_9BILA|nr:unnamed protein product [Soboliphyme baturini]